MRGFSCTAAPLHHLLQKDRDFTWTPQGQQAFNSLQKALTEAPVLTPRDGLQFTLDTDASDMGIGAVLAQAGPEGRRVVAYFSKTFNKAEHRYCVTHRELLAMVAVIKPFKYYLCGRPFTVRTDHSALQWLMSFRGPEGQVARCSPMSSWWYKGASQANADALSHRPCALGGCQYCERREARERELRIEEQTCPMHEGARSRTWSHNCCDSGLKQDRDHPGRR